MHFKIIRVFITRKLIQFDGIKPYICESFLLWFNVVSGNAINNLLRQNIFSVILDEDLKKQRKKICYVVFVILMNNRKKRHCKRSRFI